LLGSENKKEWQTPDCKNECENRGEKKHKHLIWLVVEPTHLKNTTLQGINISHQKGKGKSSSKVIFLMGYVSSLKGSQIGSFPPIFGVKKK